MNHWWKFRFFFLLKSSLLSKVKIFLLQVLSLIFIFDWLLSHSFNTLIILIINPKFVSFTALDCLNYMINGSTLIKVKASTRQYRRFFTLEEDLTAIRWLPSSKKSSKARRKSRTTFIINKTNDVHNYFSYKISALALL
jgi:hypothetical protein